MADDSSTGGASLTPQDRDMLIRTVIGEAGNQPDAGQRAVAAVVMNRVAAGGYGGSTPTQVVLAPNQFEPWSTRSGELMAIDPSSSQYKRAAQNVEAIVSGQSDDPTGGATHFLNAATVRQRTGGSLPSWAQGQGMQIGAHTFFAPNGDAPGGMKDNNSPIPSGAPRSVDASLGLPAQASFGSPSSSLPSLATALAATSGGPVLPGQIVPLIPKAPTVPDYGDPSKVTDADLDALITGKPAAPTSVPAKADASIPTDFSDAELDALVTRGQLPGAKPVVPLAPSKTPLTPAQVASGRDPVTGELVVGGKPFSSDSDHWNPLINFANGGLQGYGTNLMAGVAALKAKLYDEDPLPLGTLYDQAKSTYEGGRSSYAANNPLAAATTEAGGSLATAIPAMAAGGAGLAGVGNALVDSARALPILARAVPAAEGVGSFLAGNAGAGGGAASALVRAGSLAANGAIQGGAAGAISSGLSDQPLLDQVRQGAEFGAGANLGVRAMVGAGGSAMARLLGIGSITPEAATLAQTAQDTYGIPIRGGQLSESPGVRFLDSTLSRTPGMGYAADQAAQRTAFNRAVADTIGEDADHITPAVMTAARTRIGRVFDNVAANTTIQMDQGFTSRFAQLAHDARDVLTDSEMGPLTAQMRNVLAKFDGNGEMTGEAYQALTREGAPLNRLQNSTDSNLRYYANRVRFALDDALERSAAPDDLADLREARRQYASMKTIEPLAEKATTGDVSPALLMSAVRGANDNMAYGGGGALGDLARIGQRFLKEPPSSGTSERTKSSDFISKLGALGLAATGADKVLPLVAPYVSPQTIPMTLASMAGTYGVGRATSTVLRSPTYSNALINAALGQRPPPGAINALVGAANAALPPVSAIGLPRILPARTPTLYQDASPR